MNYENVKIFDIEIYKNFFCIGVIDYPSNKFECLAISEYHDDWDKILNFWRDKILVGYNNIHYDNLMLNYIIENIEKLSALNIIEKLAILFDLNTYLFENKEDGDYRRNLAKFKYADNYVYIDLMELIREGYSTKSLKGIGVNLRHDTLQDLPYSPDTILTKEQMEEVMRYNENDCRITLQLLNTVKTRIEMRELVGEAFKVDILTASDSGIAKVIFQKEYCQKANVEWKNIKNLQTLHKKILIADIVEPWVKFRTKEGNDLLERVLRKEIVIDENSISHNPFTSIEQEFKGLIVNMAKGGIHSVDKPGYFESNDDYFLVDIDVASWYPRLLLNAKKFPSHLNQRVCFEVLEGMTTMRLDAKSKKNISPIFAAIESGLKISINTFYGLLGSKGFPLFDEKIKYMVTLNGEFGILMLLEDLYLYGLKAISANTDGVVVHIKRTDVKKLDLVVKQWEHKVNAVLEFTYYDKYIRKDVNNYMCIKPDGSLKLKGVFVPQLGILKGYEQPVLGYALQNYYVKGIPPEEYIPSHLTRTDLGYEPIYDFCFSQKIGADFVNVLQDVEIKILTHSPKTNKEYKHPKRIINILKEYYLQPSVRFYISNKGKRIIKRRKSDSSSETEYVAGFLVTPFNNYFNSDNYDINYDYYINEAYKIINKINES